MRSYKGQLIYFSIPGRRKRIFGPQNHTLFIFHSPNIWIYVKATMYQALSRHGEFWSNQDSKSLFSWAIYKTRTLCSPKSGLHSSEGVSTLSNGVGNQVMGRESDPCFSTGDLLCFLPTLMVLLDGWKLSRERTLHPQSFTPNKCQRLV